MNGAVEIERRVGYHLLRLNRPERVNALTAAMLDALSAALDAAAADRGCRAVLLTGAGRAFCAGQDLAEAMAQRDGPPDLGQFIERHYNSLIRRLRALDLPVICAVNGVAAGAGVSLALACDIVLAARSASFVQAFVRIGLIPDAGGSYFLPRLVGEARARALAMLGEPLAAADAAAWGLIWRMVEDAQLMPEAEAMAAHLATQPTEAIALMKRSFAASATNGLDAQLDLERDLQRAAGLTRDHAEGVRAFLEKRPPRFAGRAG